MEVWVRLPSALGHPFAALLKQVQRLLDFARPDKLQQAYLAGRPGVQGFGDKNAQLMGGGRVGDQAGGQLGQDEKRYAQGGQHGQAAFTRSQPAQEWNQPAQKQDEKGKPGQGKGGKNPALHHPGTPPQVKEVVGGGQGAKGSQYQRRQERLAGVFNRYGLVFSRPPAGGRRLVGYPVGGKASAGW